MILWSVAFRKRLFRKFVSSLLLGSMLAGCTGLREKKLSYIGHADLNYYEDQSLRIKYADVDIPTPEAVAYSQKPRTLTDRTHDEIWEMTLAEAIHLALVNNKVVRTRGEFLSTQSAIYANTDGILSVYDPSIRESGVLFGARGTESALAAFDTQWNLSAVWNRNSTIQNSLFSLNGLPPGSTLDSSTATFNTQLVKPFAYGAQGTITHNWNYDFNNLPGRLYEGAYNGGLRADYTQPLWAGAGAEFTRIAGPVNTNIQGLSGVNQGVAIARINTDLSIADFEIAVRNQLRDVEDLYWEMYLAYRTYDAQVTARNSALRTWREVKAKADIGAKGGSAADEAQAREAYFTARSQSEDSLQALFAAEIALRRLCGLGANDGRIIRPADEPITAEYIPDWHICLAEALTRREELRRQKFNVKSNELQLIAARNVANPRLDFVASYLLNGFGNQLFAHQGPADDMAADFKSAYSNLFTGNQQGWQLGFNFSVPLGLRNAKAQVRNLELRTAKSREVLSTQEQEVNLELANAFQNVAWRYKTAETNFNRRRAAERGLQAFEAEYRAGTKTLDLLLQAQTRLANAETAYHTSVVRYQQAMTDIHFRKGTLLENNNVHLSEGMWQPEAYKEALRRAWARSYAWEASNLDPIHAEPEPFVNDVNTGTAEFIGQPGFQPEPVEGAAGGLNVPQPLPEEGGPAEAPIGPVPGEAVPGGPNLEGQAGRGAEPIPVEGTAGDRQPELIPMTGADEE